MQLVTLLDILFLFLFLISSMCVCVCVLIGEIICTIVE